MKNDANTIRKILDKAKIKYNDFGWKILIEEFYYGVEMRFDKKGNLISIEGYE